MSSKGFSHPQTPESARGRCLELEGWRTEAQPELSATIISGGGGERGGKGVEWGLSPEGHCLVGV